MRWRCNDHLIRVLPLANGDGHLDDWIGVGGDVDVDIQKVGARQ